jgi:hypothetical protein
MSTLSSASTLAEIQAAYADNASYAEDASPAKARAFVTACRLLLVKLPKRASHGAGRAEEIELDLALIRGELADARKWLACYASAAAGGAAVSFDLSGFRD